MNWLFRNEVHFEETNGYFGRVKYSSHAKDIWWSIFYTPVMKGLQFLSDRLSVLQNGRMQLYASYVLVTLAFFIIIAIFG
jgi:hypothetical protein